METFGLLSYLGLWALVLFLGFLLVGALRALGLMSWRLEQLEATTPRRIGRDGLPVGKKAPDFTLPSAAHGEESLHDFAGRKLLLVFTQSGCGPCKQIVPELNRLHENSEQQVLVVNNGTPEATRRWAAEVRARFPVLSQESHSLSKLFQVFATPFAFLIDEQGVIRSKGIVSSRQHLGYVLTGADSRAKPDHVEPEPNGSQKDETQDTFSRKEMIHV